MFQIEKNKGLTPKRKREQRNPRVKHRMKYRKAKIRRKGQVSVISMLNFVPGIFGGVSASLYAINFPVNQSGKTHFKQWMFVVFTRCAKCEQRCTSTAGKCLEFELESRKEFV